MDTEAAAAAERLYVLSNIDIRDVVIGGVKYSLRDDNNTFDELQKHTEVMWSIHKRGLSKNDVVRRVFIQHYLKPVIRVKTDRGNERKLRLSRHKQYLANTRRRILENTQNTLCRARLPPDVARIIAEEYTRDWQKSRVASRLNGALLQFQAAQKN